MKVAVSIFSVILLILPRNSRQLECGKRLEKGAVICSLGIHGKAGNFDYTLCTHCAINVGFRCENGTCSPLHDTSFETMYRWVQPYSSTKMGLDIEFDPIFRDYLSNRLRRFNTAKAISTFMTERNLTFVLFHEAALNKGFTGKEDRNTLEFMKEIAGFMHDRKWLVGLKVNVRDKEFFPDYDFKEMSKYMDWFSFSTRSSVVRGTEMWPLTPLSATSREHVGTTKYWIEKALETLDPECVVLIIDIFGIEYIARDNSVEPGPGSGARVEVNVLFFVQLCYKLERDSVCHEHWDDESTTPWAACGNEFYTYDNARSVKAKTDLAREYNLAGMSIYLDRKDICEDRNPILLVKALQGIRNTTSQKLKIY